MKFGVCCALEQAETVLAAGFDYVEVAASRFALDPEFDAELYRIAHASASNLFFPGDARLYNPEVFDWRAYGHEALRRAKQIGLDLMVVGSGGARRAPEGMDPAVCEHQFCRIVAEIQAEDGVPLAPESLNRSETNVGNDLGRLANQLLELGVGYTADVYHILYEWNADGREGGRDVPTVEHWRDQVPHRPLHVHFANAPRFVPAPDDPQLLGFCARLRELEYDGKVSLECGWKDFSAELPRALENLRSLFQD